MHGTIKAIKRERGFGFITDEEGRDRMFHASGQTHGDVKFDDLQTASAVTFEPYQETIHPITGRPFGPGEGLRARRVAVRL